MRKSSVQLDREIAQSVGKRIDRKKLGELMGPWGATGDAAASAVYAVSSYYYSGKKYPDRAIVTRAIAAIEADIPRADRGEAGWTKADAKDLQTIAQGLRYYLLHDYNGSERGRGHSTIQRETHTLSADQIRALRTFAEANGRSWKSKLNHAWSTGRYRDYNGADDEGSLQQIRNRFGPTWLTRFSFDRAQTHSVKG
jgi:hypothetical protein